ncbi:MAG: hypothetical protein KAJ72_05295 [Candidatus Heimdallarchaeota archaeon]|nr:hypothetical protein [Candidatus Heimdallarchaeota archaeon]
MNTRNMFSANRTNQIFSRKKAFISIIVISAIIFIMSVSIAVNADGGRVTITTGGSTGRRGSIRFGFEIWNFTTFIISSAILIILPPIHFLSKTMIFSVGRKVNVWRKYGEVKFHSFYRKASINTLNGTITITKRSSGYMMTLPLLKGKEIENYGFAKAEKNYKVTAEREEISSILHLYQAFVQK